MDSGSRNLAVLAEDAFIRRGDYPSLLFDGVWHRSAELFERSLGLGGGFAELGIRPGDRVVVLMANGPEVGIVYTALWRAGAAITPVIFLLAPDEVQRILRHSGATALVTSADFLPSVRALAAGVETLRWIVVAGLDEAGPDAAEGPELGPEIVALSSLEAADPAEIVPRDEDDLAALLYTGGTTGRSKGVALSHRNLWFCAGSAEEATYVPGMTRVIVPLPLSHAFGLITTVVGLHAREPAVGILMRWFDPVAFLHLIQEHRIQRGTVVPSMIQILLGAPLEDFDLSSLRYLQVGAAPLAVDVVREFERRVPGVEICEGYGCTESGAVVSVNPPERRKLGSVGLPIPGYEVRVASDDEGDAPMGEIGEVCCRSEGVMAGYWKDPEATEQALRGGWLHTGDLGRLDEDGYLWIVDRMKDLIIRGGFNVYPRDVEDALLEHPAVEMAGVIGQPDRIHGEEVVAFVSLRRGHDPAPTMEELVEFARSKLGAYKYPREIRIVGAVPLTPVGKVDRKALRASLRKGDNLEE